MAFYENLLTACNANGITATELLRELNMSSGNLSKWKNNGTPKAASLQKIAERLNVSVDRLVGNDNGMTDQVEAEWLRRFRSATPEARETALRVLELAEQAKE